MDTSRTPLWEVGTLPDGRKAMKLAREATEEERRTFLAVVDLSPITKADRQATMRAFPEIDPSLILGATKP